MSLAIDGLISGLDVTELVNKLMQIERKPVLVLEEQRSLLQGQKALYQDINTRLLALLGTISPLSNLTTFQAKQATSSDQSILTASATSAADKGTFSVVVNQLAKKQSLSSDALLIADQDKPLGDRFPSAFPGGPGSSQTFTITVNNVSTNVTIDYEDTLADMRDKINSSGASVSASIVNIDSVSQKLMITSKASGLQGAISFRDSTDGLLQALGILDAGFVTTVFSEDFASGAPDFTETGATAFEVVGGAFEASATTGQPEDIGSDGAVFEDFNTNYQLNTDFTVVAGDPADADTLGVYLRRQDSQNFIAVILTDNGASTNVEFRIVEGGVVVDSVTDTVAIDHDDGNPHTLSVEDDGDVVSVKLDGTDVAALTNYDYASHNVEAGLKGLMATGTGAGLAGDFVVDFDNVSVVTHVKNEVQAAQNAEIVVDGLTLSRPSNTISDAINGVTLNLLSADPATPVTVTVSNDTEAVKTTIQNFVDQYNNLINLIKEQFFFDEEDKKGGILLGDIELVQIEQFLQDAVMARTDSSRVTEIVGVGDGARGVLFGQFSLDFPIASLDDIVSITVDGETFAVRPEGGAFAGGGNQVEVQFNDTQKITELRFFDNDGVPAAVENNKVIRATYRPAEFVGTGDGTKGDTFGEFSLDFVPRSLQDIRIRVDGVEYKVVGRDQAKTGGGNQVEVDMSTGELRFHDGTGYVDLPAGSQVFAAYAPSSGPGSLQGLSDIGIGVASIYDPTLVIDSSKLEEALSSNLEGVANLFAANSESIAKKLKETLDFLTRPGDTGFLSNVDQNLQSKIEAIDRRIQQFEEILQIREERIRNQFIRMEQALGVLQAQSAFLLQQIARLPGTNFGTNNLLPGLNR